MDKKTWPRIPQEVASKAMEVIRKDMETQIMSALAIKPGMLTGARAATPKYRLAKCIDNNGLEDVLDEGEMYVLDTDMPDEGMVYAWDRQEERHECFAERFEEEETIIEAFQDQRTMTMGGYRLRTRDSRFVVVVPGTSVREHMARVTVA
jgi:hypothetical protein